MTAAEICAALRERYKQPEWALFFEVANGTGANAKRHADALAMNMYPSRGLSILGFEIKVSRSDLKKELAMPDKAEEVAKYCNEWWLAVPKGLIKDDDNIPVPWGIMECENGKLWVAKKALPLEAKPVTKDFMAAVVRSAGKVDEATVQEAKEKAWQEARKSYQDTVDREVERVTRQFQEIKKKVEELEVATGKRINHYTDIEKLAERLKMAEDIEKLFGRWSTLSTVRRQMESFLKETANIIENEEAG